MLPAADDGHDLDRVETTPLSLPVQPTPERFPRDADQSPLQVLLIENDAGDAYLVRELLTDSPRPVEIVWARSMTEAVALLRPTISCVLLDLGLPDASGLDGLHRLLTLAPRVPVIVLTGLAEAAIGAEAVAAGAQDYLAKQEIDGSLLARAILYALERKRADESHRRLLASESQARENARLERGLLPEPVLYDDSLLFRPRYRPGRQRSLLGGDFYDAVETPDGRVHIMIGDVSGHGPDEAALGVGLRIAWRTLVFADRTGDGQLRVLERIFEHERRSEELFATLCMVVVDADRRGGLLYLAGHPPPLLLCPGEDTVQALSDQPTGPALGLFSGARWGAQPIELGEMWSLMLYTDGLIEGRVDGRLDGGPQRLGTDGLVDLVHRHSRSGLTGHALIDATVAEVEQLHGGSLTDDLAVIMLDHAAGGNGPPGKRRWSGRP